MSDSVMANAHLWNSVEEQHDGAELVLLWHAQGSRQSTEMVRFDPRSQLLRIFPKKRLGTGFQEQFDQVTEIQIDTRFTPGWDPTMPTGDSDRTGDVQLIGLPEGFASIFIFGLGLPLKYRGLIHGIEDHTPCRIVRFGASATEGPDGDVFHIGLDRFDAYKRAVDRNQRRGQTVVARANAADAHNATADLFGLDPVHPILGRHPIIQAMTREVLGEPVLDAGERRMLVEQVSAEAAKVITEAPVAFGKLRQDLELVSLETLIEQFNLSLSGLRSNDEKHWQTFFRLNPFALQQLFATPVALYGEQLFVKGPNVYGQGARVADFVLVNTVTSTALVVEIKTPAARLTAKEPYRGKGGAEVYPPHLDLTGAVTQVQAQVESMRSNLPRLLADTPAARRLDTYVVRGAVIAGTVEPLTGEQKASFERYRDGLTGVEVLAFDEVRDRLAVLHELLATTTSGD